MRSKVWSKVADPAGYSDDVAPYLFKADADKMVADLDQAYRCALAAENNLDPGLTRTAIEGWLSIFGDHFPTYG